MPDISVIYLVTLNPNGSNPVFTIDIGQLAQYAWNIWLEPMSTEGRILLGHGIGDNSPFSLTLPGSPNALAGRDITPEITVNPSTVGPNQLYSVTTRILQDGAVVLAIPPYPHAPWPDNLDAGGFIINDTVRFS